MEAVDRARLAAAVFAGRGPCFTRGPRPFLFAGYVLIRWVRIPASWRAFSTSARASSELISSGVESDLEGSDTLDVGRDLCRAQRFKHGAV